MKFLADFLLTEHTDAQHQVTNINTKKEKQKDLKCLNGQPTFSNDVDFHFRSRPWTWLAAVSVAGVPLNTLNLVVEFIIMININNNNNNIVNINIPLFVPLNTLNLVVEFIIMIIVVTTAII